MVLVTGGTGLLGSHLIYYLLQNGERVRAIKRSSSNISQIREVFSYYTEKYEEIFSRIEWYDADILDYYSVYDALKDIDEVYHCAAIVSFHRQDINNMMKVNIEGTANIVNASLKRNVKKLCHVSSIASLGRSEDSGFIDENTLWKNSTHNSNYALSKYLSENEVWRGIYEGLNAVIINPSIMFGPGFWHKGSNELIKTIYKGIRFYPPGINGFVDVRDVCKAMIKLMKSDITSERFVVSSYNLSYRELNNYFSKHFNNNRKIYKTGKFFLEILWRVEKIKSLITNVKPLITKETARTSAEKYLYSSDKIKKAISIEFTPFEETSFFLSDLLLRHLSSKNNNG